MNPRHPAPAPGAVADDGLDEVVLVDDAGVEIGRADRVGVHSTATPLHLAFSTYIFNERGEVLITRRALEKKTWPGVWTNSCCGHPRPGESTQDAARRRIAEELGLAVGHLVPVLPTFRYQAVDASGIVENEICPVYATVLSHTDPEPDPAEVMEWAWVPWARLVETVWATPGIFSPWAALQVPQLTGVVGQGMTGELREPDYASTVAEVDTLLAAEAAALATEWNAYIADMGVDLLAVDLPEWLGELVVGQGKRLRVAMTYWGFVAAGGKAGSIGHQSMVRAAAALEALHLFGLIHDDVMDESTSRRGRPAAHVQAGTWHSDGKGFGDPAVFGRNLAILLGDLAHTFADRIADGLPIRLRRAWYELSVELVAGQRADLTGAAARRQDRAHAEQVARLKSGRYTIDRPLELGALAAGATPQTLAALGKCAAHIGRAFALRDDILGIWGDPSLTGKPTGDDLRGGKATVLLDLARERLSGADAALLELVGTSALTDGDVDKLAAAMRSAGVAETVEQMILAEVEAALACLETSPITPAGAAGIAGAVRAIAWRDH